MTRRLPTALLTALLLPLPLVAQSFGDGPAFGGSRVFSEGFDPLGNSARFDRVPIGWYAAWEGGDAKPRGFRTDSDALAAALQAGDAAATAQALQNLQETPFPLRREAFGLEYAATGGLRVAFGRETLTSAQASSALATEARRAEIDRIVVGAGSGDGGSAYGFTLRMERVRLGSQALAGPAPDGALGFNGTDRATWSLTSDAGFTTELTQGLRFGFTASRLIPRHFWDVYERPQARAGFELDLGSAARLSVEGDLNEAARLPLPQKQKTLSSSLRLQASPTVTLLVGAERRTVEGTSSTLAGVSVRIATAPLVLGLGFQFGDDRPQRALSARIGG